MAKVKQTLYHAKFSYITNELFYKLQMDDFRAGNIKNFVYSKSYLPKIHEIYLE